MTMRLLSLEVSHFGCIRSAKVDFGPGLNVLFGANDLGKSTLARAVRAVLLLQHGSTIANQFSPWDSDETPRVVLTFQTEPQRIWRVKKRFGVGARGASTFEASRDGHTFMTEAKAREVDGRIRSLLGWGVASPGGRNAPRGLPESFLSTLLLGEQADVIGIFDQTLKSDTDESGKEKLTAALKAFAQDPVFKFILEHAQAKTDEAFTAKGNPKRGRTSPFALVAQEVNQAKRIVGEYRQQLVETEEAELRVQELAEKRHEFEEAQRKAQEHLLQLQESEKRWTLGKALGEQLDEARDAWEKDKAIVDGVASAELRLAEIRSELMELEISAKEKSQEVKRAEVEHGEAAEVLRKLQSAESARERLIEKQQLENEKLNLLGELERQTNHLARLRAAFRAHEERQRAQTEVERTTSKLTDLEEVLQRATASLEASKNEQQTMATVGLLIKQKELERRIESTNADLSAASTNREEAHKRRKEAKKLRTSFPADLPPSEVVQGLEKLQSELELAKARLGGGLLVAVELLKEMALHAELDGVSESTGGSPRTFEFEAKRTATLRIGDSATVSIIAGEEDARRAVEELRVRWQTEAVPVFTHSGFSSLRDLKLAIDRQSFALESASRLEKEAAALDEQSVLLERAGDGLGQLCSSLDAVHQELLGHPLKPAQEVFSEIDGDETAWTRRQTTVAEKLKEAKSSLKETDSVRQELELALASAKAHLEAAESKVADSGLVEPVDGWQAEEEKTVNEQSGVENRLAKIEEQLQKLEEQADTVLEHAQKEVEQRAFAVAKAKEALEEANTVLDGLRGEESTIVGELKVRMEQASQIELEAGRQTVEDFKRKLEAMDIPGEPIAPEAMAASERAVQNAKQALKTHLNSLRKAEGALETVGGEVVREKAKMAEEALRLAEQREREV
ncbi:MAG: hypothetical protein HN348_19070, partial [Proteobacteria bacterium]|nr:hypothetical protein [Pseudomonadota bacterium]